MFRMSAASAWQAEAKKSKNKKTVQVKR